LRKSRSFFVQNFILTENKIEELIRDCGIFRHLEAEADEYKEKLRDENKSLLRIEDLLSSRYFDETEIMILQHSQSLSNYEELYFKRDIFEVYRWIALKLSIEVNKEIENKPVKRAVRKKKI